MFEKVSWEFKKYLGFWKVFFSIFAFYLCCLPKELAVYRDAGEMAVDAWTMSIPHQPGYPLYALLSRAWISFFPFLDAAYALNIFSAFCGAMACAVLFSALKEELKLYSAFFLSVLFSLNFTVQTFSSVSEMYALNILFAVILIKTALKFFSAENLKSFDFFLFAYLCGLFLGNRTDISLLYPAFLAVFLSRLRDLDSPLKTLLLSAVFFFFGLSVYFYLMARSCSVPFINWSNPCNFENFWAVITRKSYGSTLDLISLNYDKGEMFLPNIIAYGKHLALNFNLSILFVTAGLAGLAGEEKKKIYFFLAIFFFSGPFFLYLANMPPNPHSLSIVEPYYAAADLALVFIAAYGIKTLSQNFPLFVKTAAAMTLFFTLYLNFPQSYRANLKVAGNYARDVFSLVPENSILVAKKDVQLFSLWYYGYAKNKRPDLAIVSQGLSGADWYAKSPIVSGKVEYMERLSQDAESWLRLKKKSGKRIFATNDCDLPPDIPKRAMGLVWELYPENSGPCISCLEKHSFSSFKKPYNDFFVKDIAFSYAMGVCEVFSQALKDKKVDSSLMGKMDKAEWLDDSIPDTYFLRGLYLFSEGKHKESLGYLEKADAAYLASLVKAREYAALPDIVESIKNSRAQALLTLGAANERAGFFNKSEQAYLQALNLNPELPQAHFNLAVLYWDKNKAEAKRRLLSVLSLDPYNREAARYLRILEGK